MSERATSQPTPSTAATPSADHVPAGPQPSIATKPDHLTRLLAALIDGLVAFVLSLVPYLGWLMAGAYMVSRDGLEFGFIQHRSVGKHVMKLRVDRMDGRPMDVEASARRNWMWGIGYLIDPLWAIPLLGWILVPAVALVSLAVGLYEVYNVLTDDEGRRWGDRLAATKVVPAGA